MVHMGSESWCTIKDLKAGHVEHLLSYTKGLYIFRIIFLGNYDYVVNCIFFLR